MIANTPAVRRALCALERALGWDPRRRARRHSVSDRVEIAQSSAGLGGLLAPDWQAAEIERARAALRDVIDRLWGADR